MSSLAVVAGQTIWLRRTRIMPCGRSVRSATSAAAYIPAHLSYTFSIPVAYFRRTLVGASLITCSERKYRMENHVAPPLSPLPLPPSALSSVVPLALPPDEARRAGRWLWLTFAFFLAALVIGLSWDRRWHATHRFETFYSPPHLFIYGTMLLTAARVGWAAWSPQTRGWFMPLLRHRLFGTLSGPVGLTGVGLVLLGFAGLVLDNAWHTRFGLDETPWSTPHDMLGWAIFGTALGFMACRLALRPTQPIGGPVAALLGWCVLSFSISPLLGPFHKNFTPAFVTAQTQLIGRFPSLLTQPGLDHVRRIVAVANLTRTNPVFVLFGALWVGLAIALIRTFDRRLWMLVLVVAGWSLVQLLGDRATAQRLAPFGLAWHNPAQWLPPPILPATLTYVLLIWRQASVWAAWAAAGLTFGVCAFATWGAGPVWLFAVLGTPFATLAGAWLGGRVRCVIEAPTARDLVRFAPLFVVTAPVLLGLVDLWLRHTIP